MSSANTTSDTPFVTSVPVIPILIPTSAIFIDGASFTPSPVIAVIRFCDFNTFTILVLCSGCTRAYTEHFFTTFINSSSDSSSISAPVIASFASFIIFRSFAIATAVSLWSPVIIIGLIPAFLHSSIAPYTSFLHGSIIPTNPIKVMFFSSISDSYFSGFSVYST